MRRTSPFARVRPFALSRRTAPQLVLTVCLGVLAWVAATAFAALACAMVTGVNLGPFEAAGEYLPVSLLSTGALAVTAGAAYHGKKDAYVSETLSRLRTAVLVAVCAPKSPWDEERGDSMLVAEVSNSIAAQRVFFEAIPIALASACCALLMVCVSPVAGLLSLLTLALVPPVVAAVSGRLTLGLATKALSTERGIEAQAHDSILRSRDLVQYESGVPRNSRLVSDMGIYARTRSKVLGIRSACIACGMAALALCWALIVVFLGQGALPGGHAGVCVLASATAVLFSLAYRPHVIVEHAQARVAAEVIDVVLTQAPAQEQPEAADVSVFGGAEVHAVASSDIQGEVLHDASLVIEPGSVVSVQCDDDRERAVLCGLFLGHYEADKGFVALSGVRIEAMSEESLRHTVVPVTRKTPLFTGTVRQNLRIGRPSASDADLVDACREAGLASFVSEGDVLGLEVDDPALSPRLTAEVRQRIGLARAILSDAPFIVMNDPTGDLGPLEEARFLRSVERLAPARTVLIVTRTDLAERIARASYKMESGSLRAASIDQAVPDMDGTRGSGVIF